MMKLYNDDCQNVLQGILEKYPKHIIVSDPPFNIGYHYSEYHDKMPENEYYEAMGDIFGESPSVVIHYPEPLYKLAFQIGKFPEKVVSWVYNSNTAKQHRDIAFFDIKPDFKKVGQPYKNPNDKRIAKRIADGKTARLYDWWEVNQVKNVSKKDIDHPAVMPLEVMMRVVGILPDEYVIVDPFMGSGTTGIACQKLGRGFVGIESDTKYFELAKLRLKAELQGRE